MCVFADFYNAYFAFGGGGSLSSASSPRPTAGPKALLLRLPQGLLAFEATDTMEDQLTMLRVRRSGPLVPNAPTCQPFVLQQKGLSTSGQERGGLYVFTCLLSYLPVCLPVCLSVRPSVWLTHCLAGWLAG